MKTKIVGWFKKDAWSGEINGRHIESKDKICFNIMQTETGNPTLHGASVDTLKLLPDFARSINGGSDDYNKLINCEIQLEYQIFNGRSNLVNITVVK